MKKTTLIIAILFASVTTFAQDLTSKKGESYLPEAGEWAVGIDASPLLSYFGNFIGGNGLNTAPTFGDVNGSGTFTPTIFGKMFIDANTAYRGFARIGFGSTKSTSLVPDADPNASVGDMVEDEVKVGGTNITLGAGLEKRKGNSRLQGVYGAQAAFSIGTSKTTTTYGNDIEDLGPFSRVTELKQGSTTGFSVSGFIGAEYFFAPKMSIGGEYTWGLGFSSTGASSTTTESYNGTDTDTDTAEGGKNSNFGIDTGVFGNANLRLMFHF